ncbi:M48 family metallopeptidase [Paenibacillus paridis]|uniref:M48 family metallopeptidase n=1 Tax=Paenibacillus paridis TaxID=2583376 RepID=UPI0011204966|nr:M48 family metallopeptidase [Paenibacillus paridis]
MNSYELNYRLVHKKEEQYYTLALVFSILVYLGALISVVFIFVVLALILLPLFAQGIMLAHIRTNGVRITSRQFPEIFEIVQEQCGKMGFEAIPDVFVMESSGVLNAFASRFFRKNMVVLYSDLFELIQKEGEKELAFVIAHELAHLKRKHLSKQLFILPAMWLPFLGEAYSRACEYTCDRMAVYYTNNVEAAMNGLTILAIGKTLYRRVDREEYLLQSSNERGLFVWLSEKLSTHPTLPKRIYAIQQFAGLPSSIVFKPQRIGLILTLASAVFIVGALSFGFLVSKSVSTWVTTLEERGSAEELLAAASASDASEVQALLDSGADPNAADEEGWTSLMWAAQFNETEIGSALLDAGANPDLVEFSYEETALTIALYNFSFEMVTLLLEEGANPDLEDSTGWTPLMTAATNGDMEAAILLLKAGANPAKTDHNGYTAGDYASDNGFDDLALLLQKTGEDV